MVRAGGGVATLNEGPPSKAPWRVVVAATLLVAAIASTAAAITPGQVRARVDHHLRKVADLVGHFETVLGSDCPRLPGPDAWASYVDGETDRLVSLAAHLEQAWVEAKRSPDDDIRRAAKAPRRQTDQARQLVGKLSSCAALNNASFSPLVVWRRIERELPRRQAEIALPE